MLGIHDMALTFFSPACPTPSQARPPTTCPLFFLPAPPIHPPSHPPPPPFFWSFWSCLPRRATDPEADEAKVCVEGAAGTCLFSGPMPGCNYMEMSHTSSCGSSHESSLRVHLVEPGKYCARVSDLQSYGEVNKEVGGEQGGRGGGEGGGGA